MRLTAFRSGKGDCLLLSNQADTFRILVDGGMPAAFREHVSPQLGKLQRAGKAIDLIYVSHIDQDHIGGVLELLDDEAAWRVFDFQEAGGNPSAKPPKVARPPTVGGIWHNAFHEQLTRNAGPVEEALAAMAPVLAGSDVAAIREAALRQSGLVTSIAEAIKVSRRIGPKQLNIPLNAPSEGKLLMRRPGQGAITLETGFTATILGPTPGHMTTLRKVWNKWLRDKKTQLRKIQADARRDESRFGTSEFSSLLESLLLQAESFGNPKSVTPPNLASLTLLVEEGEQTIILTGDARGDQILDGLEATGRLSNGTFMTDVLKVPHHGSENNIDSDFCDAVLARHYVFCGNGEHENPDRDVVEMMARRRLAADPSPFRFWFTSSEKTSEQHAAAEHMRDLAKDVKAQAARSHGRFTFRFLTRGKSLKILAG